MRLTRKKGGNNNKNKASFGVVVFLFASPLLLSTTAFTTTAALGGGGTSSSLSTRTHLSSSSSSSIVEIESETETGNKMSGSSAPIITFEDIAKYPGRAFLSRAGAPTKIVFGPDDDKDDESNETSLIYLGSDGNTLTQKLWKRTIQIDSSSSSDDAAKEDIITELAKPPDGVGEEDTLSAEEKLRRERTRQLETGITNFEYSGNKKVLLCPIGNDLFIKRSDAKEEDALIQIVDSSKLPGSVIDPHISYDGSVVVFVCNNELYSVSTITNADGIPAATKQLTFDAARSGDDDGIVNGLADFIAMEEMSRNEGFWISPNSNLLAFEQSDESHIPKYRIMHSGQADPSIQEDHRYPFAGEANPKAKMGIISINSDDSAVTRWLDLESIFGTNDMYLARVQWGPTSNSDSDDDDTSSSQQQQYLYVQVMNREQTEVVLLRFDLSEDDSNIDDDVLLIKGTELLREKSPPRAWVNLHENLIPLKNNKGFIWASERNIGYRHLYYYDENNRCHPITSSSSSSSSNDDDDNNNNDEWMVETCTSDMIDEANNLIYFTGTKDSPKESHLYCTSILLKNENEKEQRIINRITPSGGIHSVLAINIKKQLFIDSWSSIYEPHQVALRSLLSSANNSNNNNIVSLLHDGSKIIANDPTVQALGASLQPPEWFDVYSETTNDNDSSKLKQKMYGSIYKPDPTIYGDGPYPTIVSVYGGPHAQMVTDSYGMTADLRAQRLRQQGYAVIKLDNRGSARRGLDFEIPIYHNMGNLEVDDQVTALKYMIDKGIVDSKRIGIMGWSYGGYMSAMCLAKRPDIFKVAVAGAMVSSWDGYDTCYTERYMGTPKSNPIGYVNSDVMPYTSKIDGSLLLVHGLIDENVHFRHTARFINSLIKARKYYELLLFPDERHVPRGIDDKVYMEERITSFIERCL